MIVFVWVFMVMGHETSEHPGVAYVQATASPYEHDYAPEAVEATCEAEFHARYPDICICESGWHRQEVRVMGE